MRIWRNRQTKALLENLEGVDAIWVLPDGSYDCTEGFAKLIID